MDKREYVACIEKALVGKVSPRELQDTVQYYRDYIDMEIRKGKSEQEVLERLGDPRLLAKTIAMTRGSSDGNTVYSDGGMGASDFAGEKEAGSNPKTKSWHIPLVAIIGILLLLLLLIASLVMSVLQILLPIILPVLIIVWIVRLGRRNR